MNNKYKFIWGDYQSLITIEMNFRALEKHSDFEWNQINHMIEVTKNNVIKCYHGSSDMKNDIERGKKFLVKDYRAKYIKKTEKECKNTFELFNEIKNEKFEKYTNDELVDYLGKIIDQWAAVVSFFRGLQDEGTHMIIEKVKSIFSEKEMTTLLLLPKPDIIAIEHEAWQKLIKEKYNDLKIKKHLETYPWLVAAHYSWEDIELTIRARYEEDKKNIKDEKYVDNFEKIRKEQEKVLKKVDKKTKDIVFFLQELAFYRARIKSCWAGLDYYSLPVFDEISKRTNVDMKELGLFYLLQDIENLFQGKAISADEIENRKKLFVGHWEKGKITYASGSAAEEIAKRELGDMYQMEKVKEFSGQIANIGKIRSVARLLGANDMVTARKLRNDFKKGQILVTQMTQPNIMDIASRAGGIVTDEGGTLSHAAIISRELKIPCIVGTSIATDMIEDGDMVEVDADKGVVKIIKK